MKQILVLHGNRQTGEILLGRMTKLYKKLKNDIIEEKNITNVVEKTKIQPLLALDAPFLFQDETELKTWWNRKGPRGNCVYEGLDESLDKIHETWSNSSYDFDGILGFSQGARLVHLIAVLHELSNGVLFPHLHFVILASGYDAPMPSNFSDLNFWKRHVSSNDTSVLSQIDEILIKIPSLHIYGINDQLVLPSESIALTKKYQNAQIHAHEGNHFVPMKASNVTIYMNFIQTHRIYNEKPFENSSTIPDEEHLSAQVEECEALQIIFPNQFQLISSLEKHPIQFLINLYPQQVELWPCKQISLKVQYTFKYPDSIPSLSLHHDMNSFEFQSSHEQALLHEIKSCAENELGMPCIMSCVLAAQDFFENGMYQHLLQNTASLTHIAQTCQAEETFQNFNNETNTSQGLKPVTPERLTICDEEGQAIAKQFHIKHKSNSSVAVGGSSGGRWHYTIGLVGKPSAGKSTFFNVATAFLRNNIGASMAPHPFTTINPNVGYCFLPAPFGMCPEDDYANGNDEQPIFGSTHGRDEKGRRFIPIMLKDVAGLVPGAYQGRGKGNKFLNDLTDADVLIHVVDVSGTADSEGNQIHHEHSNTTTQFHHPKEDLSWIRQELLEWICANVAAKWDSILRRGKEKLIDMFSGYKQSRAFMHQVLVAVEQYSLEHLHYINIYDNLATWDEGDLRRLVSAFLGIRFPMSLALNKSDLPSSNKHIQDIQDVLPSFGAWVATPLSAQKEMLFMKQYISSNNINTKDEKEKPQQVWNCLTSSIELRLPIFIFPVHNMTTYESLAGLHDYATRDASLPNTSMISCLQAAGGTAPSCWNHDKNTYDISIQDKVKLRDCILMKPGSTVEDLYTSLKYMDVIIGDFVRAEAACYIGESPKPVAKGEILSKHIRIIKIMTNKRKAWQKKHSNNKSK